MATEGTPKSQAAPDAGAASTPSLPAPPMSGTLALLAASAVGSFLGSRLGGKPLAVAIGATALAWLSRQKAPTGSPVPAPSDALPRTQPVLVPAPQALAAEPPSPVPAWPPVLAIPGSAPVIAATPAWAPPPVPVPQALAAEPAPVEPISVSAPVAPAPFSLLPPPPDPAIDARVQAWLARQMDREERASAQESVILSEPETPSLAAPWPPPEPVIPPMSEDAAHAIAAPAREETTLKEEQEEDDYRPEPLVADPTADSSPWQPDAFAALTEPRPGPASAPASTRTATPPQATPKLSPPPAVQALESEPAVASPAVPQPVLRPPVVMEDLPRPVFSSSFKPLSHPLPAHRPPTAPLAAPGISASAIPGIEPLPSWNEISVRRPQLQQSSSTFLAPFPSAVSTVPAADLSAAPTTVGVDLEALFDRPVHEGSPLPDEIHVSEQDADTSAAPATAPLFTAAPHALSAAPLFQESACAEAPIPEVPVSSVPAPASTSIFAAAPPVLTSPSPWAPASAAPPSPPAPEDPMESFFSALKAGTSSAFEETKTDTDMPAPVPEIDVQVAAVGEAWFDSPLAAADVPNPWLPPKGDVDGSDVPLTSSFAPLTPSSSLAPVVEAEVVLRPRAPTQASVVAKNPPVKPAVVDAGDPAQADVSAASTPVNSSAEQKARANWRSWWKGD